MDNAYALPLRDKYGRVRAIACIDESDRVTVEAFKWHLSHWGYAVCSTPDMRLHRFIMKAADGVVIDHINGNRLDNRRCNLRATNNRLNVCNQRKHKNNTTGYKGVSFNRSRGIYVAQIMVDRKTRYLGGFQDPKLAHEAYMEAARELFGDFANPG